IVIPVPAVFFFSSRRRHTRFSRDWSSDVCSSDLLTVCSSSRSRWGRGAPFQAFPHLAGTSTWGPAPRYLAAPISATTRRLGRTRSEERRVGKECRWRWAAEKEKKEVERREAREG